METDRTRPESALRRLGQRTDVSVPDRDPVHLVVECDETAAEAATERFFDALRERLTILATDPKPEAIVQGAVEDRYHVLATCDVPSPVLAARLMRIDVGKELEPRSTVSIEIDDGRTLDARSWLVEIVDDGSPPGWDEPARLAAGESDDAPGDTDESAPGDLDGADARADGTRASDDGGDGEGDLDLDRLVALLAGLDGPDGHRLRERPARHQAGQGSLSLRLRHLEATLQSMEGYAAVLEQFVDEHGTPKRAFDALQREVEAVGAELGTLRDELESLERRHDGRTELLEDRVDAIGKERAAVIERLDGSERRLDRHDDALDQVDGKLDRVDDELDRRAERLEDHRVRIEDNAASVETLQRTAGKLFALQRAQWTELVDRIERVESRQRERVEELEARLDEREETLRRTIGRWITDAELELFELENRVEETERWRRSLSDAVSVDREDN